MDKIQLKEYFNRLSRVRQKRGVRNRYYHNDIYKLLNFLIPKDASVLDVGCGDGEILSRLGRPKSVGIDFSPVVIASAEQQHPAIEFLEMDAEYLCLNKKFDYVVISDTIGFLSDIQSALSGLHRICHPKSKIIITYYNYLWEPILKLAEKLHLKTSEPIQNWVSCSDVDNLLYLAGFEIVKRGERLLFPKYFPLLSSFLNFYLAKMPLLRHLCLINYVVARPRPAGKVLPDRDPSVTVLIPARNEKGNIETAVQRVPKLGSHTEIIFVEGNSTDSTWEEIGRVKAKYSNLDIKMMKQDGRGKGDAVRKGFDVASGDILMILDADLTVRPEELPKFYQAIASGAGEFINGSRLVYQLEDQSMRLLNIFGNKFFSLMFSWLLDQRLKDTLCGTKVIWKDDYERVKSGRSFFGDFDPFGDYDLLFGAAKLNLKIVDLPIRYQARTYGTTNISRFRHGWLLLQMCFFAMKKIKFI
ncbi:MAG: bifunctional class I SAM-dependent methyltransferase/glycosyltransferase family 2 protein [Candidatus Magasanikbacteria bacterium]